MFNSKDVKDGKIEVKPEAVYGPYDKDITLSASGSVASEKTTSTGISLIAILLIIIIMITAAV